MRAINLQARDGGQLAERVWQCLKALFETNTSYHHYHTSIIICFTIGLEALLSSAGKWWVQNVPQRRCICGITQTVKEALWSQGRFFGIIWAPSILRHYDSNVFSCKASPL